MRDVGGKRTAERLGQGFDQLGGSAGVAGAGSCPCSVNGWPSTWPSVNKQNHIKLISFVIDFFG